MSETATLSARYRLTIPKKVRESRSWEAGQEFAFIPKGKGVLVIPVPDFEDLKGIATGADPSGYRERPDRIRST